MAHLLKPGPNEITHFQADLKKLTRATGSKISDPVFKPFAIFENEPKRELYLVHFDSHMKEKRSRLQETICEVSSVPKSDKDFGGLPFAFQIDFSTRDKKSPSQVYQCKEEQYEVWCSWLHYVLKKGEHKPLVPVNIPECSLRVSGPCLLQISDGGVVFMQPSVMLMTDLIKILHVTSFGITLDKIWFRLCHFCAKTCSGDNPFPQTEYKMEVATEVAGTSFIARLRDEGRAVTAGVWSMGKSHNDESFLLNHAAVCPADNLWNIRFNREFLRRSISIVYSSTWQKLARAADYAERDILTFKSSLDFLQYWIANLPSNTPSEPKTLLELTESAGLTTQAMELRHMFLDPTHSNAVARPLSPLGTPQPYPPEEEDTHETLDNYSMSAGPGTRQDPTVRPLPNPAENQVLPSAQFSRPAASQTPPLGRRVTDPNHPLAKPLLTTLGYKVEEADPEKWDLVAMRLIFPEDIEAVVQENPGMSCGRKLTVCLEKWKSGDGIQGRLKEPTAPSLVQALNEAFLPDVAYWYEANCQGLEYSSTALDQSADAKSKARDVTPPVRYKEPSSIAAMVDIPPVYPTQAAVHPADRRMPALPPSELPTQPLRPMVADGGSGVTEQSPRVPLRHSVAKMHGTPGQVMPTSSSSSLPRTRPSVPAAAQGGERRQQPKPGGSGSGAWAGSDASPVHQQLEGLALRQEADMPRQAESPPVPKHRTTPRVARRLQAESPVSQPSRELTDEPPVSLPPAPPSADQQQQRPPSPPPRQQLSYYDMPLEELQSLQAAESAGRQPIPPPSALTSAPVLPSHRMSVESEQDFLFNNPPDASQSTYVNRSHCPDGNATSPYVNHGHVAPRVPDILAEEEEDPTRRQPVPLPRSSRSFSSPETSYVNVDDVAKREYVAPVPSREDPNYTTFHQYPAPR